MCNLRGGVDDGRKRQPRSPSGILRDILPVPDTLIQLLTSIESRSPVTGPDTASTSFSVLPSLLTDIFTAKLSCVV